MRTWVFFFCYFGVGAEICPIGWEELCEGDLSNGCYRAYFKNVTYWTAYSTCAENSSSLLTYDMHSEDELDFVFNLTESHTIWQNNGQQPSTCYAVNQLNQTIKSENCGSHNYFVCKSVSTSITLCSSLIQKIRSTQNIFQSTTNISTETMPATETSTEPILPSNVTEVLPETMPSSTATETTSTSAATETTSKLTSTAIEIMAPSTAIETSTEIMTTSKDKILKNLLIDKETKSTSTTEKIMSPSTATESTSPSAATDRSTDTSSPLTTATKTSPLTEVMTTINQTTGTTVCPCEQICYVVYDPNDLKIRVQSIKQNLTVDTATLSTTLRKLTCATDPRPSSAYMGYTGAAILSLILMVIVIIDCLPRAPKK